MSAQKSPCWAVSSLILVPLSSFWSSQRLVPNRERSSQMDPRACHRFPQPPVCPSSTKYSPTGHRTSTKPSQVHHPALSNRTLEFWLHFCCSSVIPPGRRSGAIAQELSVQTTNTKIPIPLVTSCVTLGSYFTPVCLNYEMRKTVPKHRIVMQMRGINALMQLRAMANIPQELKR